MSRENKPSLVARALEASQVRHADGLETFGGALLRMAPMVLVAVCFLLGVVPTSLVLTFAVAASAAQFLWAIGFSFFDRD